MKATKSLADLLTFWLIVVFVGFSPLTALASSDTNKITKDTTWSVPEEKPYMWVSTSEDEVYVNNDMVSSTTVDEGAKLTIVVPINTSAPYPHSFQEISGGGSVHFKRQWPEGGHKTDFYFYGTDGSGAEQPGGTAVSVSSLTDENCGLNIKGGKGGDGGMGGTGVTGALTAEDCGINIEGGKGGDGGMGGTGVTGALTAGVGSEVTVTGGEGGDGEGEGSNFIGRNGGTGVTGALTVGEGSVVTVTGGKGGSGKSLPGNGGTGVTGEVTLKGGELTVKGGESGGDGGTSGQAFGDDATVTIKEGFAYTDGEVVYPAGTYTKSTNPSINDFAGKTLKLCEAKIGDTFYATLQNAFNAAEDGATITLVRDVEQKTTLNLAHAKSLSLDLNGRKMLFNFNNASVKPFIYDDQHLITIKGSGTIEAIGLNASGKATIPLWRFVHDAAGTGTLTILDDAVTNFTNTGDRPWVAFKDSITAAVFDENVTKIGSVVLRYCKNLKTVTIPASVESIVTDSSGNSPFDDCPKLEKITVDAGNSTYSNYNDDGVLYTKDKTTLIYCPRGKTGTLTVPAEVTTLAKYAFNGKELDCVMSLSRIEFAHTQACTLSTDSAFGSYTGDCVLVPAKDMLIDNQRQALASNLSLDTSISIRAVTPWDSLQDQLNEGGTVKLTRSYDYTKDSYEINGWGSTSHYGKLIVPKGTALDLNGYTLAAVEFYVDGEFTVKGGTLNCTRLTNNERMGDPTNTTYGTLTLDNATVTADQLVWFGGMALTKSTLTVGESEEGAGSNGKNINVTWVQPKSGAMLTMDTASSVTLPQQQETDDQWRLTDFQTSEDVAAAARQLGAYLPRGWTFENITGKRVYGASEQPYYALAVKDTAGAYPTSVTLRLITDSVPATVTANDRTYDGTEQPLVTVDNTNLVGGVMVYAVTDEETAPTDDNAYDESIPEATNAGTYYVWYKVLGDATHHDTALQELEVVISPASVTLTANSATETYDGTAKTVTGYTSSVNGLTFAETVIASCSETNAGAYDVTFTGVTVNQTTDTTGNYVVTEITNGILTIDPIGVTLTANSATETYDGTAKTVTGYISSVNGLTFAETVAASCSETNAGAYDVTFTGVTVNETKDTTGNYVVTGINNGILTINPASVTLTANSATETYDGTAKTVTGYTSSVEGLTFAETVAASGTGTNEGEYDVTFTGVTVNQTKDTTGNYVVTGTTNGKLTINPASVILTANSATETYDGTAKTVTGFTASVEGLTFEETITASGTGTNAGEYDVTFTGVTVNETKDTTGNYVVTGTTNGKLTINRSAVTDIKAPTPNELKYNGESQALVTAGEANGGTMQYALGTETEATEAYTTSIPTATEAGTYYVWYRVEGDDNHSDSTPACATVTIGKAAARITKEPELKDIALNCTGSEQELIIPGEAEGGEIRYCVRLEKDDTMENDPPEAEFTTSIPKATETANGWWNNIWYRVVGDNNHDDGPIIALGSVMMCPGTLSLNLAMEDWYVGEPASTPSLTGNLGGGKVVYSYKPVGADDSAYSETVPTEPGSYLIWAKVEETKNFGAGETIAAFLILEKQDPQENPQEGVTVHTETEFRQTVPDSPVLGIEDTNGLMNDTLKEIALSDTTPVGEGELKNVHVRLNVKSTSLLDVSPLLLRTVREYAATCSSLMRYSSQEEDFITILLDKEVTILLNEASMKGEMMAKSEFPKGAPIRTFTEQLTHLDTVLEIPLRYDMTGKYGPVILRIHDNEVLPLTRLESPEAVPADGTFYVEGSGAETVVHLYTKLCTLFAIVTGTGEPEPVKPESSPEATLVASLKATGTDKMKLSWLKVKGANYYDVYFGKEGAEPVLLESVGAKKKSLNIKNLEKGTTYVAYVQPWKQAGGEKTLLGNPSPVVYAVTNGSATEVNAKGVYVNSKRMTMMAGTEYTLNGYVKGGAKGKKLVERVAPLRFYSDNINVAEVAPDGTITAVGEGKCLIYTLSNNGMYKATKVVVIDGPTKIRFSKKNISMQAGSQKDITSLIKTSPNNITTPYTLTTDSETVATVDSNGIVTAVGPGRAVITVTTPNNKTAKLTIRVKGGSAVSKSMEDEPTLEIITEDTPEEEFPNEESAPSIEPEAEETSLDLESLTE